MKKIIFTMLLSVLALSTFAQNDSLYVDGMKWITWEFNFDDDYIGSDEYYFTYIIDGDTAINGCRYKKMKHLITYLDEGCDYHFETYFVRYENGKYLFYLPDEKENADDRCYVGDDYVFFDENLKEGDLLPLVEKIYSVGDTVFDDSPNDVRKYWKKQHLENDYSRFSVLNDVLWVNGIGSLSQPVPYFIEEYDCACYQMLLYCTNSSGDTIYRNQKFIDLVAPYLNTNVPILKSDEISFTQRGGECVVTLPLDAAAWEATLSNSVGVTVARRSGEGSEIILPATSKGTHILVVNVGGKVVKKKVFIK